MSDLTASFRLPLQQPPGHGAIDLHPRAVQSWIEALPLADVPTTARTLLKALHATNRSSYPWGQRLHFLDLLVGPLVEVDGWLRGRFINEPLPLRSRPRLVAELTFELQREAAIGFLIAAESLSEEDHPEHHREPLARAAAGALNRLGQALLTTFQARIPGASELWGPLHALFLLCSRHGVERLGEPAPEQLYKRALLLAAADPLRLRPKETAELWDLLRSHAADATLDPAADTEADEGFLVDPHEGSGPIPLFRAAAPTGGMVLGVRRLMQRWEEQRASLPPVVAAVLRRWAGLPQGREERHPADGEVELLVGLGALHERLREAPAENEALAGLFGPARFAAPSKATLKRLEDPFIRALGGAGPAAAADRPAAHVTVEFSPGEPWHVEDTTGHGMRISHAVDPAPHDGIHTGEIVGVTSAETLPVAAAVRWVRLAAERVEAGLELLPGTAAPAAVSREKSEPQRALLLSDHGNESLVLYSGLFSAGQTLDLLQAEREDKVVLGGEIERCAGFTRFRFAPCPTPTEDSPGNDNLDQRFADIWGHGAPV